MNKLQKILGAVLVIAMLVAASAVFAQDDTTTDETTTVCSELHPMRGENPIFTAFDELEITRDDIQAYIQAGGTMEEFLAENGIDIEAIRTAHHAQMQVNMLLCVNELEADGTITSEQAAQLRDAITNNTMYELFQSGEFDDVFPRLGQGFGNGFGGFGQGFGHNRGFGRQGFGGFGHNRGFGGQGFGGFGHNRGFGNSTGVNGE